MTIKTLKIKGPHKGGPRVKRGNLLFTEIALVRTKALH